MSGARVSVAFRDEGELGDVLLEGTLEVPAELTVLELLLRRIEHDCTTFAGSWDEPFRGLVQTLAVHDSGDEIVLSTPAEPDSAALLDVAAGALDAGTLEVSLDDVPLTRLGALVAPLPGSELVFVKHAPLLYLPA